MSGWYGVDFDGTLAAYGGWVNAAHCGEPVRAMVDRVKQWRVQGIEVRIFTARVFPLNRCFLPDDPVLGLVQMTDRVVQAQTAVTAIRAWCRQHIGEVLPITNIKDYGMVTLYDDRCVQVRPNTGELVQ